jgi:hypothetical protein
MNVLILSPDAVGGTLLNKLIATYMQLHEYDRPVIDIPHPEYGVSTFFSPELNQTILSKNGHMDADQNLQEIIELYKSVDHYKISKLTHYSMKSRNDSPNQSIPFYRYFNDNFFVIACRRENLFEHALSWGLTKITKAKNVYSHYDKISKFIDVYQNGITIDPQSLVKSLEDYKEYLQWVEQHFHVASYYCYEKHLSNIENYIFSLPIFAGQQQFVTWKDAFGINFNDWNRCHRLISDIGTIALNKPSNFKEIANRIKHGLPDSATLTYDWAMARQMLQAYNDCSAPNWPKIKNMQDYQVLPDYIKQECEKVHAVGSYLHQTTLQLNVASYLDKEQCEFLNIHAAGYLNAVSAMERMHALKLIRTGTPIKKQTLAEKKLVIKNFDQCAEIYNHWIQHNPELGIPITSDQLELLNNNEQQYWNPNNNLISVS